MGVFHRFKARFKERTRQFLRPILMEWGLPVDRYENGPYLYCPGGYTVFPESNVHLLEIADDVETQNSFFNLQDSVTIESGVVLGHGIMFVTGCHQMTAQGVDRGTDSRGPILVKKRAWIASGAIIIGGVTIGEGAMIGAGSIVTKSVPNHEFWAGNPAKLIRKLDDAED